MSAADPMPYPVGETPGDQRGDHSGSDLVEFLQDRLDEDEAVARACPPWPWRQNPDDPDEVLAADDIAVTNAFALSSRQMRTTATHIARWDPARVLTEVEARRLILDNHEHTTHVLNAYGPSATNPQPIGCETCHDWDGVTMGLGWCTTLRALALPHTDHPDYDPAWLIQPAEETAP